VEQIGRIEMDTSKHVLQLHRTVLYGCGARRGGGGNAPSPVCYLMDTYIVRASEPQHASVWFVRDRRVSPVTRL
jgi:hypothetical protein